MTSIGHSARVIGALFLAATVAACSAAGASNQPTGTPNASGTPAPSATSTGPIDPGVFYLRAWETQALEPHQTFGWNPVVTIADGRFIDGRISVPVIYPGLFYAGPSSGSITEKGIKAILDEARTQGLLGDKTAFFAEPGKAGAEVGHILIVADGRRYDLSGDTTSNLRCRCIPDSGSPGAFAAFWGRLSAIDQWIPAELGQLSPYTPERLAVLAIAPVEPALGINPNEAAWPLPAAFDAFGLPFAGDRCGVVSGADLAKLLPVIKQSNQLTRFVDANGARKSLQIRVLVPDEPSPCQA